MKIFFYGLFMDERLLASKGIEPSLVRIGYLDGYGLRIGERATLERCPRNRAYGMLMDIPAAEVTALYAEQSVADYIPESVVIELMDGTQCDATCYNLPANKVTGTNKAYAERLLDLATTLEFPESYLEQLRQARAWRHGFFLPYLRRIVRAGRAVQGPGAPNRDMRMNTRKVSLVVVILVLLLLAAFWLHGQLAIDSCLDAGGAWNDEREVCEYE